VLEWQTPRVVPGIRGRRSRLSHPHLRAPCAISRAALRIQSKHGAARSASRRARKAITFRDAFRSP
jgi:hypothetical protein